MLKTRLIPPNVNFHHPNPAINWHDYKLRVPIEKEPLEARSSTGLPLISLCSSGIGGANGHIVLEGPPTRANPASVVPVPLPVILVAGGLTPRTAVAVSESLSDLARKEGSDLARLSTLYGRRVRQMTWRTYAVVLPGQTSSLSFASPLLSPRVKPPIVLVFSGQGPQHVNSK